MAAADGGRSDGGIPRRARGLDRRHAADGERARPVHADRAVGSATARLGARTERLAGGRDAPRGSGRVRGYLGSGEDRDWFSITPSKTGLVMGTVNAPAGVDVIVFRDEDAKKVVNRRGAGDDEQFALDGEAGKPLFIGIARKLDGKGGKRIRRSRRCRGSTTRTSSSSP